jgi:hypothetical protein
MYFDFTNVLNHTAAASARPTGLNLGSAAMSKLSIEP